MSSLCKRTVGALLSLLLGILPLVFSCALRAKITSPVEIANEARRTQTFTKKSFTVMTYNIRVGCGSTDRGAAPPHRCEVSKENLLRIAEAIESIDPDVVGLQEVKGVGQARFLAEKLNLNYSYGSHPSGWWGLAILSKYKILNANRPVIHGFMMFDSRSGLECTIYISGKPITFLNVHYRLGFYKSQISRTIKTLNRATGPIVLIGDLNRSPLDPELKPIQDRLLDTCEAVDNDATWLAQLRGTLVFPTSPQGRTDRIDYIFVDPAFLEVKDAGLIPEEHWRASDHIAYFARIALK